MALLAMLVAAQTGVPGVGTVTGPAGSIMSSPRLPSAKDRVNRHAHRELLSEQDHFIVVAARDWGHEAVAEAFREIGLAEIEDAKHLRQDRHAVAYRPPFVGEWGGFVTGHIR